MERGGSSYTYHRDALGSVTEISDSSGNLVERYEYDVYGQPEFYDGSYTAIAESAIGNPYLFTGRRYDPESGNYYYRARIYSPTLGRFLSMDPLGYGAGDANLYRYTFNNPANLTDPSGKFVGTLIVGGLILGAITGFTYDVMVNQGKGGIENVQNGNVFSAAYYCDVDLFEAFFNGGIGLAVGATVDALWSAAVAAPQAINGALRYAQAHAVSAASQFSVAYPNAATLLAKGASFLATGLELSDIISDLSLMVRSALGDPIATAQLQKAMATWNPTLGIRSAGNSGKKINEEYRDRLRIVNTPGVGGKYNCLICAEAMHDEFDDTMIFITSPKVNQELVGIEGEDIGAPKGWHVIINTNEDVAWDNFGEIGSVDDYLKGMRAANPDATFRSYRDKDAIEGALLNFLLGR